MELNLIDGVRTMLVICAAYVLIVLSFRYVRVFKMIDRSQKLIIGAFLSYCLSTGLRSVEAIQEDDGFRLALVPFLVGVILSLMYLAEPSNDERNNPTHDIFTPQLNAEERRELQRLRVVNAELSDRMYELASRNNELRLQVYDREET